MWYRRWTNDRVVTVRTSQQIKRTIFAHFPLVRAIALTAVRRVRRIIRVPHQKHYAALRLIIDNPDDLYLDIGANRGQSIESIRLYKPNPIISFEVNPLVGQVLKAQYPDQTVHVVGLGKVAGEFTLYVPAYKHTLFDARASIRRVEVERFLAQRPVYWFKPELARVESLACSVRTLDSFGLTPFLVKIDMEGTEEDVIDGGMRTIQQHLPILIVEQATKEILSKLEPLGYKRYGYIGGELIEGAYGTGDVFVVPDGKRHLVERAERVGPG